MTYTLFGRFLLLNTLQSSKNKKKYLIVAEEDQDIVFIINNDADFPAELRKITREQLKLKDEQIIFNFEWSLFEGINDEETDGKIQKFLHLKNFSSCTSKVNYPLLEEMKTQCNAVEIQPQEYYIPINKEEYRKIKELH